MKNIISELEKRIITAAIVFVIPAVLFTAYTVKAYAQDDSGSMPEYHEYDPASFDPLDCTPLTVVPAQIPDDVSAPQAVPGSEYWWWMYYDKDPNTMLQEYEDAVATALAGISSSWTDEQKLCYLHDYICLNADYDYDQAYYSNNPVSQSAYGNLVLHKSVCDGYARAFYDLANRAGIETYDVVGDQMNHAWNLVALNGTYYYIDCTFDDSEGFTLYHKYFLMSQTALAEDHTGTDWNINDYYNIGIGKTIYLYGMFDDRKYDNAVWKNSNSQLFQRDGYSLYVDEDGIHKYYGNQGRSELAFDMSDYDYCGSDPGYFGGSAFGANNNIFLTWYGDVYRYDEKANTVIPRFFAKEQLESVSGENYGYFFNITSIEGDTINYEISKSYYSSNRTETVRSGVIDGKQTEPYFSPVYDEEYFLNSLEESGVVFEWDELWEQWVYREQSGNVKGVYNSQYFDSPFDFFLYKGMSMGIKGSKSFDPEAYKNNNKDLRDRFGNNNLEYYFHYLDYGKEAGRVAKPDTPVPEGCTLLHRMYNPNSGEHFYTKSGSERYNLILSGWKYEGDGWIAPDTGDPVYRLYNENAGDHHYTMSGRERDNLVAAGWKYEGIGWYSAPKETGTPLYRLYNPNASGAGSHHYTTSEKEKNSLMSIGWKYEGIGWYGLGN